MPFRFLLDSRVFRLLCEPGKAAALDSFRTALAHHRLAPDGVLPEMEMTPLAILDVLGVAPPPFPGLPLPKSMATLKATEVAVVLIDTIQKAFRKAAELAPESLKRRVDELRETTDPAAHELFDMCLTRFVSRESFEDDIVERLAFDALFTFRFPEEYRERMSHFFNSSLLLSHETTVSGLTKVRRLKVFWDTSLERIVKRNPMERGEILALDQEMKPRTFKDFLGWEVVFHSVVGYPRKRVHPVIAFSPGPTDKLMARCKVLKTALRVFLDEIPREELVGGLQSSLRAWTPGWLVPCQPDGTLEAAMFTGEAPAWGSG